MPIVKKASVAAPQPAPKPVSSPPSQTIVNVDLAAIKDANAALVREIEKLATALTSGRKRVTVRVLDRDRDGRIERAVFDVVPVKE